MNYKSISIFCITALLLGCGNKEKTQENKIENIQSQQEEIVHEPEQEKVKDKLEEHHFYKSIKGSEIQCVHNSDASASFFTTSWLSMEEIKAFMADREVLDEKTLSFSYKNLELPPYAAVVNGIISYNEDIPHSLTDAKKYQQQLEVNAQKEQEEKERLAKIQEEEEDFRHDEKNFNSYLNSITIGTTMKDFNQAIYMFSDSGNEYLILYNRYGKKAEKLKEKLIAKQKNAFPIIRQRYVEYFRTAFRVMGRGDIKFVQSGTTLNLLSDEFYESSVWPAIYESMGTDMANYRFKKLILKSSGGQVLKQYTIRSKNDMDL